MRITFRCNPPERNEYGEIFTFDKAWLSITMSIKNAPDEQTVDDAFGFIDWYMYDRTETPCEVLGSMKHENGVYSDILTFERTKRRKDEEVKELIAALRDAKEAYFNEVCKIPQFIIAATRIPA